MINIYKSVVKGVDFSNAAEAVGMINKWASKKTHGVITELLQPGKNFSISIFPSCVTNILTKVSVMFLVFVRLNNTI